MKLYSFTTPKGKVITINLDHFIMLEIPVNGSYYPSIRLKDGVSLGIDRETAVNIQSDLYDMEVKQMEEK